MIWVFQTMLPDIVVPPPVVAAFGAICTIVAAWFVPNPK
jgi:hypothetical protein